MTQESFEETIRELTQPINGQLPRPWMTKMANPLEADVFIVGMNQRNGYPADQIAHEKHLDALFNRNGESCRGLYDEVTNGKASRTRLNTDSLTARLNQRDVHNIIETNVVCFSTPLGKDLLSARCHLATDSHRSRCWFAEANLTDSQDVQPERSSFR